MPFYGDFLSRPVCNLIHGIVLQFYVFIYLLTPHVVSSILPAVPSCVVQSCSRQVRLKYLRSAWGPVSSLLFRVLCCQMVAPWNS
jgi:hypothetical protein